MYFCIAAERNSNPNAHLAVLNSNGLGAYYLSANNNAYYVAIDSNSNIQVIHKSQTPINVRKLIALFKYAATSVKVFDRKVSCSPIILKFLLQMHLRLII